MRLNDGVDQAAAKARVEALLADEPEVSVSTVEISAQQAQIFSFVLIFVQLLLGLAMIIAVLGIVNTLRCR